MKGRFCGLMFVLLLLPQWRKESQDKGLCTETCPLQLLDYFFVLLLPGEQTFTPISVLPTVRLCAAGSLKDCMEADLPFLGYTKSFTVQSQTHESSTMNSAQLRSRRCDANLLTEQGRLTKGNVTSFSPHI